MEDYKPKLLPVKELVSKIQEMGLNVNELDFYQPNSRRIIHIFECFIYLFSPKRYQIIEELRSDASERLTTFDGSTAENCSLDAVIIFKMLSSFLESIRFRDIQLTDLLIPTSRRIIPIMNVLVNFAIFCQPRYEEYLQVTEKIDSLSIATQEAKAIEKEKIEGLNHKKAQKLKDEQERHAIVSLNNELFDHIASLKKELEELQNTIYSNKKDREAMKDQLHGLQYDYVNYDVKLGQYKKAQETDTEKMLRDNETMKSRIQDTSNQLNVLLQKSEHLKSEINLKETVAEDVENCIAVIHTIKKNIIEMNRQFKVFNAVHEDTENSLNSIDEKSKLKSQLNDELTQCEVELEELEEQALKSTERTSLYYKALEEKDKELENFIASNNSKEQEYKEQIKVLDMKCNQMTYDISYLMQQYSNKVASAYANIEKLNDQLDPKNYNNK